MTRFTRMLYCAALACVCMNPVSGVADALWRYAMVDLLDTYEKIDPATGAVVQTITHAPGIIGLGAGEFAYGGGYLWRYAMVDLLDTYEKIDPATGAVVQTITHAPGIIGLGVGPLAYEQQWAVAAGASPIAGGSVGGGGAYDDWTTATVTSAPHTGYQFLSWTEGGAVVSASASYSFTATGNRTLVANFAPLVYSISLSSAPAGGGSTTGGGTVNWGASVTAVGTANPGYSFVSWTEAGVVVSTSPSYSFTASANRTLVANFVPETSPGHTFTAYVNSPFNYTIDVGLDVDGVIRSGFSPAITNASGTVNWGDGTSSPITAPAMVLQKIYTNAGTYIVTRSVSWAGVVLTMVPPGLPTGAYTNRDTVNVSPVPLVPHPADTNNAWRITIDEVTGYGAAWKRGDCWPTGPASCGSGQFDISIDYVTQAGYLWKNGECYTYDSSNSPPLCWVSTPCESPGLVPDRGGSNTPPASRPPSPKRAAQSVLTRFLSNGAVSLSTSPAPEVRVYAVEEALPAGLTPCAISDDVWWDSASRKIKWGLFFDNCSRVLSYKLAGMAGTYLVHGVGSFDGQSMPVVWGGEPRCGVQPPTRPRRRGFAWQPVPSNLPDGMRPDVLHRLHGQLVEPGVAGSCRSSGWDREACHFGGRRIKNWRWAWERRSKVLPRAVGALMFCRANCKSQVELKDNV